ncbi:hypothetical protein [Streptomyces sp. NPDC003077]|uniref:hypothetical protein n=1 Tax=Streptomyces sp. NPDC003077 TaxID=3154443 RepID=UPI0033A77B6E
MTVTNTSDKDISPVRVAAYAWRQMDDEPALSRFVKVEYKSPGTGAWTPVSDDATGLFVTDGMLKARRRSPTTCACAPRRAPPART